MTVHCLTPNPALDITYRVADPQLHAVNRVDEVDVRPGGKGLNVARLIDAAEGSAIAHGPLGGKPGEQLAELLTRLSPGVGQRWVSIDGSTRSTIAIVDLQDTTMFNESGPPVTSEEWTRFVESVSSSVHPDDVVTVSGSLPTGCGAEQLQELISGVRGAGAVIIVDTSGPNLLAAADAGTSLLKPNRHELEEATGESELNAGILNLLDRGAEAVLVSLGEDGLLLAGRTRQVRSALPVALRGNPTGAGDAVVAAIAHSLSSAPADSVFDSVAAALPLAVAWSASAVLSPVAGEINPEDVQRLLPDVKTEEITC